MLKQSMLTLATLAALSMPAMAASVTLASATSNNVTANLNLDSSHLGQTLNVYVAATFGGKTYLRGSSATDWREYTGGPLPVAATIKPSNLSATISAVDFDLSLLPGVEIYVAFGVSEADIYKSGHLSKVYSSAASSAACDTSQAPAGISYTINGNNITVTTNGKCVAIPANAQACSVPFQPAPTGVSVLTSTSVSELSMSGITINIPGLANPFDAAAKAVATVKSCTRNAPADYGKYNISADVCYDITSQVQTSITAATSAFISLNPPVTARYKGNFSTSIVADCFSTGASVIMDAYTKEAWIKQTDGSYKKP